MATSSFQHTAVVRAEMRGSSHSYNWSMNPKSQGRLPRSGRIMVSREWSPMQPIFHLHVSPGIHPVGWISVSGCTSRVSGRCAQPGYSLWPQATTPPQWSGVAHHCTLALVIPPVALGVAQPRVGPPLVGARPGGPPAPPRQGTPTLSVAPPPLSPSPRSSSSSSSFDCSYSYSYYSSNYYCCCSSYLSRFFYSSDSYCDCCYYSA